MSIPINKNRRWVSSLHGSISQLPEDMKAAIMKQAGMDCAADLWSLCEKYSGKPINTIEDLVHGWNMVRDSRNLEGRWEIDSGTIRGTFYECGCPLVRSGLIELHPVQCYCSQGMMENVFSKAAKKAVEVVMKRSIGRGDNACEFIISL